MNKVDIRHIVLSHYRTMTVNGERLSYKDMLLFIGLPVALFLLSCFLCLKFEDDVYSIAITAFSIFTALLLTVQVALFGIYERKWDVPSDEKERSAIMRQIEDRKSLLSELNTNISYLTIMSCLFVTISLVSYIIEGFERWETAISVAFYTHIFLTIIMVLKRTYALFEKEYNV